MQSEDKPKRNLSKSELVSLAFELGYMIAFPIVIFAFLGSWLDKRFGTVPLYTVLGVVLAVVSTTIWIYRKFKVYFK